MSQKSTILFLGSNIELHALFCPNSVQIICFQQTLSWFILHHPFLSHLLVHVTPWFLLPLCCCACLWLVGWCVCVSIFLLSTGSYLLGKWAKMYILLRDSLKSVFWLIPLYWWIPLLSSCNSGDVQMRQLLRYICSPVQL